MIFVTTATAIEGYQIVAYKGVVQALTFDELQAKAEALGANAILNTCYDNALDVETLFHGAAVVIEPIPARPSHLPGGAPNLAPDQPSKGN